MLLRRSIRYALMTAAMSGGAAFEVMAATLPVPCASGTCGPGVTTFVSAGQGGATVTGSKLTVTQATPNATFNWQSFNISADGTVQFVQPNASSVALNRIFQADPAQIFGALNANGRVFLINQNGIVFGPHAQVNVGSLLASTLNLAPLAANGALLAPSQSSNPGPALVSFTDAGGISTSQAITVQPGASITTAEGGQILMFAPTITNAGTLASPGGQTILGAGQSVYLTASNDTNLRGLLVEVGVGGTVTNGTAANATATSPDQLVGRILADRGNVTLAGLAVNQDGYVSATTTVNANGSIRLQARDQGSISAITGAPVPVATHGGTLVVGANSVTEVALATGDPTTAVDSVAQLKSDVALAGASVTVKSGSLVSARGGTIEVYAARNQDQRVPLGVAQDGSRINIESGALLDVSGANVELPVSSNVIAVQLRGTELADSPLQQSGPLRGQTVYVDVRANGVAADGTHWQGTPLANVSGEIAAIPRTVAERNLAGGTVSLVSQGDVIVSAGARLDLAGGSITFTPGYLKTSTLVTATGQLVDMAHADPNLTYVGIAGPTTVTDAHWGTSATYGAPGQDARGVYAPGYVEGKDAGSLALLAPQFVLDGAVNGAVVQGPYQRAPAQPVPTGSLYRPVTQAPLGATLVIGTPNLASNHVTGSVAIAPGEVLAALRNADGTPFDPASDPLPAGYAASVLRPELLGPGGFAQASIYANGGIVQAADAPIALPAGGALSLTAASVALNAPIDAPSGSIAVRVAGTADHSITNGALTLGSGAELTARGQWINDNPTLYPDGNTAPEYINGGQISLSTQFGDLTLRSGSSIDVSGGGWLNSRGVLTAGDGGGIRLTAVAPSFLGAPTPVLSLGAGLSGYALSHGGSLALTAGGICIAAGDCSGGDARVAWLAPDLLTGRGFGSIQLTAGPLGLAVAPGTVIALEQQNLVLPAAATLQSNAATLEGVATPALLADYLRAPMNLSLAEVLPANAILNSGAPGLQVTASTPSLVIGTGAVLEADPGAALTLASDSRVIVDGTLRAPGGSISLGISSLLTQGAAEPTQGIWLGSHGVLDAAGVARIVSDPNTGLRSGQALAGGTVAISANRGAVELLPGSRIDVAGATATIDVTPASGAAGVRPEQIASAGGTLALTAAEGIVLGGALEAHAGTAGAGQAQPAGGTLSVALSANNRNEDVIGTGASLFSSGAREIQVSDTVAPVVVGPGLPVPDALSGQAIVPAAAVHAAGFDTVALAAQPFQFAGVAVRGSIQFAGDVNLAAGRQVTLDAATLRVAPGGAATVAAPFVQVGNSDPFALGAAAPTGGTGTLDVAGGFVELFGPLALQGVGHASVTSAGDLRLRGVFSGAGSGSLATAIGGGLYAGGDVTLTAQQVYPSTLSQFRIATDPASGTIVVRGAPGQAGDVLSAGGSLTLSAATIDQGGVLRAPFGSITLSGTAVTLAPGSLTSTSADGLMIPFGTTQGGFDWVYPLQSQLSIVYGADGVTPPSQRVSLQGTRVTLAAGAVVDVSGGGDLLAYEWINGVGGTRDVLSAGQRPNQYAIVPGLSLGAAPYDPSISAGSALRLGDSVHLAASPGLPAGNYVLLPARYALLPGAFLVTPVSGYPDLASGQTAGYAGGGTIVSGYRTVAGTTLGDSRASGFAVVPASIVLRQAQYTVSSGNSFFAAQAAAAGAPAPRLPRDAGIVAITAGTDLTLDGALRTQAAASGDGAVVGIASNQILVAGDNATPAAGTLVLGASSLNALGAQTLLLGGQLSGNTITASAQTVTIGSGAKIGAPQLILAATGEVVVGGDASVLAAGAPVAPRSFTLDGTGAWLDVSTAPLPSVSLGANAPAGGVLLLSPGSTVGAATGGSAYLYGSAGVSTAGQFALAGGDLGVQSTRISLGTVPAGTSGTVLDAASLGADSLRSLMLSSASTVDLYGTFALGVQQLGLSSGGLRGFGAAADAAGITVAGRLSLSNPTGVAADPTGSGTGTLHLAATDVMLAGDTTVSGFANVAVSASHTVTVAGDGSLSSGGGLAFTTPELVTAAGTRYAIATPGPVSMLAPGSGPAAAAPAGLGGAVAISAGSIEIGTRIDLPSGQLSLDTTRSPAAGSVTIDAGAVINVAGVTRTFDQTQVASPGGTISVNSGSDVTIAAGSTIDVSAAAGGAGGSLAIAATAGQVQAGGTLKGDGAADTGAAFSVDARSFGDFGALNQALNAGGFLGARSFRLRGPGDLVVAAGAANTVRAESVTLEADGGSISINGLVDASGTRGGHVLLAAAGDVQLNGAIAANATGPGGRGGSVDLDTIAGRLLLNRGATIDVSGRPAPAAGGDAGAGGQVHIRVPQALALAAGSDGGLRVDSTIVGASRTTLEGFATYQRGSISAGDVIAAAGNPLYDDATSFMAHAPSIAVALGKASDATFVIVPGVEIDSPGALRLATPWDLSAWRFNNAPGVLTLRAAGGVDIAASLSDGFASASAAQLPSTPSSSWSYRIVAGADLAAAAVLAVNARSPADIVIEPGVPAAGRIPGTPVAVRTGDGSIDVAASGSFVLGNEASVLYTAGVAGAGLTDLRFQGNPLRGLTYPVGGGDIRINVGGDVVGAPTDQFVTGWLWRVGGSTATPGSPAIGWTVNFQMFQQGVAALGGGDVTVHAGGDIRDLSVSIPEIGHQVGGTTIASSVVDVSGGGVMTVSAGGSIQGGSYYIGIGQAQLTAGRDVGAAAAGQGGTGIAPLIGVGDASVSLQAVRDLTVAGIVNPTLLPTATAQRGSSFFSTYGATSAASLTSVGGQVTLPDQSGALQTQLSSMVFAGGTEAANAWSILPPTLTVAALSGDVNLQRNVMLMPSASGSLAVFAERNVNASSPAGAVQLVMSDADPATLPTPFLPGAGPIGSLAVFDPLINAVSVAAPAQHGAAPAHASGGAAAEIVAATGDIEFEAATGGNSSGVWTAGPARIVAGRDIVNLDLTAQNLGPADVTLVSAGRDLSYPLVRVPGGQLVPVTSTIAVDGPGNLEVVAGRNINLGVSNGIETRGALVNPAMPAGGASVTLTAGVRPGQADYAKFIQNYILGSDDYDSQLVGFVATVTGAQRLSADEAKAEFATLSANLQQLFADQVFLAAIRASGRKAAAAGNGDFSAAFAAIDTLFPGANPDVASGQTNAYAGDISLYFSRVYTLDGGDVAMFAPGGGINVGLANPPSAFNVNKTPSELGIVAQSTGTVSAFQYADFQVNQSRVFAADGGNILVWSTDGNIDAGRGAKTSISAPPPTIAFDANGQPTVTFPAALFGSGIQTLATTSGVKPGDVDLFAPHGVVNANDAGIVAGNLTVAATAVLGSSNITVSGASVGVPVAVTGLGASVAGAAASGGSASSTLAESGAAGGRGESTTSPAADSALGWLEVFVTGLGEEACRPDDLECLKRQPHH